MKVNQSEVVILAVMLMTIWQIVSERTFNIFWMALGAVFFVFLVVFHILEKMGKL